MTTAMLCCQNDDFLNIKFKHKHKMYEFILNIKFINLL
jgi:hypothetical protein